MSSWLPEIDIPDEEVERIAKTHPGILRLQGEAEAYRQREAARVAEIDQQIAVVKARLKEKVDARRVITTAISYIKKDIRKLQARKEDKTRILSDIQKRISKVKLSIYQGLYLKQINQMAAQAARAGVKPGTILFPKPGEERKAKDENRAGQTKWLLEDPNPQPGGKAGEGVDGNQGSPGGG